MIMHKLYTCDNLYIDQFKHTFEVLTDEGRINPDPLTVLQVDSLRSHLIAGYNSRIQNMPTTDEIAAIVPQVPADA